MYTFKKEERLCSLKLADKLFHDGSSFLLYPFRISWLRSDDQFNVPAQVIIQVPKRRFKRAVDRNLLKRRIREIYRLNKANLLYVFLAKGETLLLSISYVGKEIHDYDLLEEKLKKAFKNLEKEYTQAMKEGQRS
jgi:ribonuclease P protein component